MWIKKILHFGNVVFSPYIAFTIVNHGLVTAPAQRLVLRKLSNIPKKFAFA